MNNYQYTLLIVHCTLKIEFAFKSRNKNDLMVLSIR